MRNGHGLSDVKPQGMILNAVHGEYAKFSPAEIEGRAKAKLAEFIAGGQKRALAGLKRIELEVPEDRVVPANLVRFTRNDKGGLVMNTGKKWGGGIHHHALGQFANKVGMPVKLLNDLKARGDWGQKLAAHNLSELAEHGSSDKVLVRSVGGEVRGVLSASYRTDDSRPALDALLKVAKEVGAVVADADALDTRVSVKIMMGKPIELFKGEWAVFGIDYRTSDYGNGARELMGWILRLLCLNGAVTTTNFRKVHLGARIQDETEYSQRTRRLNEEFTASATRDMARALLGPEAIEKLVVKVRAANAADLDADAALASLKKRVTKDEEKQIVEKYNSPDVTLLPPGNTAWRFSNAISWLAGQVDDADRKLDLQRLSGEVVEDAAKVRARA